MSKDNNDLPFPSDEEKVTIPLEFKKTDTFTKAEIKQNAANIMAQIADGGEVDTLQVYVQLKALELYIKECIDEIKEPAMLELDLHGKEGAKMFGIQVIQKNAGKKYAYDNYDGWIEVDDKIKDLTEQRKEIEKRMKNAVGTAGIIDEDTGEVIPPADVLSEGKSTILVSIPSK